MDDKVRLHVIDQLPDRVGIEDVDDLFADLDTALRGEDAPAGP